MESELPLSLFVRASDFSRNRFHFRVRCSRPVSFTRIQVAADGAGTPERHPLSPERKGRLAHGEAIGRERPPVAWALPGVRPPGGPDPSTESIQAKMGPVRLGRCGPPALGAALP